MGTKRFRKQMIFWLNLSKDDEFELFDYLESLKRVGEYSKVLRDGVRLVWEFRKGQYDLLKKLFPKVFMKIRAEALRDETIARLEQQNKLMLEHNELLKELKSARVMMMPQLENGHSAQSNGGPKALSVPTFELPEFDDDDDIDLEVTQSSGADAVENFMNSVFGLTKSSKSVKK